MPTLATRDALVIGSGPNGLAAAIVLAQAGCSVSVLEAAGQIGGGSRSEPLTLPGFVHDVCSAVHPLAASSPFFRTLPLQQYGLEWVHPAAPAAHPLDDGSAVVLERSLEQTAALLQPDRDAYLALFRPLVEDWNRLADDLLAPLRLPRHPLALAQFGLQALRSAEGLARSIFRGERARALFAGMAGHSATAFHKLGTAAFGLVLTTLGHAVGWPFARGGSQRVADALHAHLRSLGGEVITGFRVDSLAQLPPARLVLCDLTPRQLLKIAGDRLPLPYRRTLERYRYGEGVFKMDWALDGPIPWTAPECARAGTIHLGGPLNEIATYERAVWFAPHGSALAGAPFVILAQPTLFDPTRAPAGGHVAWAYCHVPHASPHDVSDAIEAQVERFAPGFRRHIVARHVMPPAALEQHNPNLIGGDINGGVQDIFQMFTRPGVRLYGTPAPGLYLCSSSTPPGGGVHGMCGYWAAQLALKAPSH